MAERDFRFERHYELWKEQNRQVARWAFLTLVLAPILLLRVLVPYNDLSKQAAARQKELVSVGRELDSIKGREAVLAKMGERLEAINAAIQRQPWMAEKKRLIGTLSGLEKSHRALASMPLDQIVEALGEPASALQQPALPARPGSAHPEPTRPSRPMGQQFQGPAFQQVPPLHRQPGPAVQAAALLQISPEQVRDIHSSEAFHRLLDEQTRRRVQEEADDKVRRIFQTVNDDVIQPLERMLGEDPEVKNALAEMPAMLASLRKDMDRWLNEHIGDPEWYRTIQGKDRELRELTEFLRHRQETFATLLRNKQQTVKAKKAALAELVKKHQGIQSKLNQEMQKLQQQARESLPKWIRDLVSIEEVLQLYPPVLLLLAGVIGFKTWLVRHHYLVVRQGLHPQGLSIRDSAASSVWTLVYRGALGTAVTAATYLAGTVLLWWLFERGCSLLGAWLTEHPDAVWGWAGAWLPVFRWLGRLLFAAAVVYVPAALLKDRVSVLRRT